MIKVIGVRFRTAGKIYFFDPCDFDIKRGDHVIVETARGIEFGTVMTGVTMVEEEKVIQPLKPVLRIANERDIEQEASNKIKEREAFKVCQEKIRRHELDMKLIDAEYTFDNNKVLFYFTADGRIDFRDLVKDLAGVFKTRIELRQIGVRDETKIVGGIGICGRPLCCHSYLADFVPVSIKMAKEQNLSLNPTKISGVCGRLMCCLKNEEDTYEELNRRLPGIGDFVTTEDGLHGEVASVNVLRQLVKVVVEEGDTKEIKEYPVEKLQFKRRHGKKANQELSKEELQELEKLEKEEKQEQQEAGGKQEGGKRRDNRNRGEGEGRREDRKRGEGEGRREDRNRGEGEGRREDRNRGEGEGRREDRNRGEGEGRREDRRRGEGEGRREDRNRGEGEGRRDNRNRGQRRDNRPQQGAEQGKPQEQPKENVNVQQNAGQADAQPKQAEGQEGAQEGGQNRGHHNRNRHRRHGGRPRQEGQGNRNDSQPKES